MALTDGVPVFAATLTADRVAKYLLPIEPCWDGGHLGWLWSRARDQPVFWPWNSQELAFRADTDVPSHGENDAWADGAQSPEHWAAALRGVCVALGVRAAHLLGHTAGAATVAAAASDLFGPCIATATAARPGAVPHRSGDAVADKASAIRAALGGMMA